jgi:hypothetical protein
MIFTWVLHLHACSEEGGTGGGVDFRSIVCTRLESRDIRQLLHTVASSGIQYSETDVHGQ